ncbi:Yae1-N domain containing protein [Pyrenophora tritici-repentis]|nr:Yae1-N domain containing protein [Pyrenophora tritici-repentis]
MADQIDSTDPFDTLLTLEDTLYTTAYTLGASDGAHAGRIEGRIFGLEKGFEKFAALGVLHGRSVIWASRLPNPTSPGLLSPSKTLEVQQEQNNDIEDRSNGIPKAACQLPPLQPNPRLHTNTPLLHSLTDPETFSTANTEDAVADYDDRFKRAGAKAKVIERIVGKSETNQSFLDSPADGSPGTTARGKKGPVRVTGNGGSGRKMGNAKKGDDSMEDFAGSSLLR